MTNDLPKNSSLSVPKYMIVIFGPSLLVIILYWAFEPSAFRDGQFILAFILSIPTGLILGIGMFISSQMKYNNGWAVASSGVAVMVLCIAMAIFSASSRGLTFSGFVGTALSPWCVAPMVFGVLAIIVGLYEQRPTRSN